MRSSALLLWLVLPLAPALAAGDEPVLLVKHEACFVHALPALPAVGDRIERVVARGHELLHTSRTTGTMTRLVPATGVVAFNTRRPSLRVTRIPGVAADAERLYVLLWQSGRITDRPPAEGAKLEGGRHALRVFRLAYGSALSAPPLGPAGLPAAAPAPSLGHGPLTLVAGGAACFGTTVRYDGRAARDD